MIKHRKEALTVLAIGKYKLKPQYDSTTHLLEWLKLKRLTIANTGKDAEVPERSYTAGGN